MNDSLGSAEPRARKTILLTGGGGYIGATLLPLLLERGYTVRMLDLLIYGKEAVESSLKHPNLSVIAEDFRNPEPVAEAMEDIDAVIHLGGLVGDQACSLNENLAYEVNVAATRMIAETARSRAVRRFILASTCSVYGVMDDIVDERTPARPVSSYARGKLSTENMLLELTAPGFEPVILRFATMYGLSQRMRFDLVVNLFAARAVKEGLLVVYGGKQWRPFIHVHDAALGLVKVLEAPAEQVAGEVFNVGFNEANHQIADIGAMVNKLVPSASIMIDKYHHDERSYHVNFRKINKLLGFTHQWDLERGIRQMVQALANGKLRDYQDSSYDNAKYMALKGISLLEAMNS